MRVTHVMEKFSELSETFLYDYVTSLSRRGIHCHVLAKNLVNLESRPHQPVDVFGYPPRWHPVRLMKKAHYTVQSLSGVEDYSLELYRHGLLKEVRRQEPDVIHAHLGRSCVIASWVAAKTNTPLVASFHGKDAFALPRSARWYHLYQEIFSVARAVTVVSNIMKEHLISLGACPEQVHVIRVGKRLDQYKWRLPRGQVRRWISVGRLIEKKGYDDCVAAFARIAKVSPGATLEIIGEGPLYDKLNELIFAYGLEDRISLLGGMHHLEVIERMSEADAFVLCSKTAVDGDSEGVPTVLMEAQALGLPCVSTLHSGIPEVMPQESKRFLAHEADVDSIAAAMEALLGLPHQDLIKLSKWGRGKIECDFNLENEIEKLIDVYSSISETEVAESTTVR